MRLPPNFPDTSDGENGNSNAGTRRRRRGRTRATFHVEKLSRAGMAPMIIFSLLARKHSALVSVAETETFMLHGIAKPNYL